MNTDRLTTLLSRFPALTVLVVGDFFLDKYLIIEHALGEISLETGLEAHQVVGVRCQPGAAGTVTNNLRAMGVNVLAAGIVGDDGEGFELLRALDMTGVNVDALVIRSDRFTPTYTKPMLREPDGSAHELNRLDIKNRTPLAADAEDQLIAHLRGLLPRVHGVIIADQVQETDCGVITERVRDELSALALAYPTVAFLADSRVRVGLFEDIILKPNAREAASAVQPDFAGEPDARGRRGGRGRALRQDRPAGVPHPGRRRDRGLPRRRPDAHPGRAGDRPDRHRRCGGCHDGRDLLRAVRRRHRARGRGGRLPGRRGDDPADRDDRDRVSGAGLRRVLRKSACCRAFRQKNSVDSRVAARCYSPGSNRTETNTMIEYPVQVTESLLQEISHRIV